MADGDQHVLVVDDEAQIRQFVRAGMELGGYRVTEAANGGDALREITLHPIDLVILDLALPDIDGSELLERIRGWSGVPVIILSVRAGETEKVKLLELGADDYVVKPFFMSELLARAKVVLRRQSERKDGESALRLDRLVIDFASPEPAQIGVGAGACQQHTVLTHLRSQAATENRGRSKPTQDPADRTRRRLPAERSRLARPRAAGLAFQRILLRRNEHLIQT